MDTLNILLEISIYSSAIFLVIMLLKKCFKSRMSPLLHYAVWMVLVVRLMIPLTVASPVHLFVIPAETQNQPVSQVQPQNLQPAVVPEASDMNTTGAQSQVTETNQQVQNEAKPQTPLTVQTPVTLSLPQIIIIIWLAGAGICLSYIVVLYSVLRRKFRRNAAQPSKRLIGLFEEVKAELGVKANVRLVCQYEYGTPSLMFPKTIMMPVDALVAINDEQAKFALRHELMHFKRGDQIMSILLSLLNAVYWFNPFVWIAFRQIHTDMEIACDGAVVRRLDDAGRSRYASLIVSLFARPAHRQLVLGMAQANARKVAEQRVRGIFMKGKSRRSVKLISALLVATLLVTCFTTACQPTPSTQPVVGRQQDILSEVSSVPSSDFKKIQTPAHINETDDKFTNLKITYDADVTVPDATAYPITEVTEKTFSDDDVLSFIKLCAGSNDVLYSNWLLSKSDYLDLLTEVKPYVKSKILPKDTQDNLQEMYDKAPADVTNTPISSLSDLPSDQKILHVYAKTSDNTIAYISFGRNSNSFDYSRGSEYGEYISEYTASYFAGENNFVPNMGDTAEGWAWLKPGDPEISQQDAYNKALEYKNALKVDLDLYSAEPCTIVTDYIHKTTGWQFIFTRTISGLQTQYKPHDGNISFNSQSTPSYGAPWSQEFLMVTIDKDGLAGLAWNGASQISSTAVNSAQLEDFDTIHQRITNQLSYKYAAMAADTVNYKDGVDIEITGISLGISMLSVKDKPDMGEYLPTWYVSYTVKYGNESEADRIMFSAVDGSYIEPRTTNDSIMGNMQIGPDSGSAVSSG